MKYNELANKASLEKTVVALREKGYEPIVVRTKNEALAKLKEIIPAGVSIMNGSSVTLEQIGFVEYLKSNEHQWNNLHAAIVAEKDPVKQAELRKKSVLSDYYLGSVHALAETGEFIVASNTGSQLPHIVFTSPNLILVVSTKKIVKDVKEGLKRLNDYVVPLEDEHMMEKYNMGTQVNKVLIFRGENKMLGRKLTFILIKENLGF